MAAQPLPIVEQTIASFRRHFGSHTPDFAVAAPGRVNLISEHTDYNGFDVLPCCIARHTVVAARRVVGGGDEDDAAAADSSHHAGAPFLAITHSEPTEFASPVLFKSVDEILDLNRGASKVVTTTAIPLWIKYVVAAFLGVRDAIADDKVFSHVKFQLTVGGNLPRASGVSSSSSLVVACAMAFFQLLRVQCNNSIHQQQHRQLTRSQLADICIRCERFCGTASGGMDQSAILLSQENFATNIHFFPALAATPYRLPAPAVCVWLVANARNSRANPCIC